MCRVLMSICCIRECSCQGIEAFTSFGVVYNGNDPSILFCSNHFARAANLYFEFKAIADDYPCFSRKTNIYTYTMNFAVSRLKDLLHDLDVIISLRSTFQASLKPEIVVQSPGHENYILFLKSLREDVLECFPDKHWKLVTMSKKSRFFNRIKR